MEANTMNPDHTKEQSNLGSYCLDLGYQSTLADERADANCPKRPIVLNGKKGFKLYACKFPLNVGRLH